MSQGEMTWASGLVPMIEPEIASEIISRVGDLALVVSRSGQVLGVLSNPAFRMPLGFSRWEGQPLSAHLTVESIPKFEERLASFLEQPQGNVRPVELNHKARDGIQEFPVRYSFHRIGKPDALLMLGQDLRPVAEMQQQLVAAQIALERDYEAQREFDTRLRVLMAATPEGTVFVSASTGVVSDCNPAALALFGKQRAEVIGAPLHDLLDAGGEGDILGALTRAAGGASGSELPAKTRQGASVTIRTTLFRATGEQLLLCQIRNGDVLSVRSDKLDEHLSSLFERGADGIVFVDKLGNILSANEAFLRQSDVVNVRAVKGRAVTDFLGRGSVDLNVMRENALRTGAMRLYATRLIGEHGAETQVEIASTVVSSGKDTVLAMVIRDASRSEAVRSGGAPVTDVDMSSVIELIGSQTLKSIVAKTTDVIEKMCIETAVELTSNNRVAAAEMLGLSRQSLYVKLRKYDLLKKDQED
ncbi:transcriptional regulator PpsR (plasmid) [Sulfitobacter alexandrii]|uniref:Transcriptional regulator PpsR n=1 Tax=Sulfitobacter alexandrii TaxID=1917485 RepID=A0A1J0WNC6_9RHOB|nr:transcriptional regulator PpsR [Sulfitobacter alexandrii]APE45686.1 transcriptional regulator PpsR [Sulfitobacter alexandrii]